MNVMNFISDLKQKKSMWKIRVKVIRLWKQYTSFGGETIEMVLVDAKGDKIHASIKKELVHQFEPFFIQGCSKLLFNFALTPSCGSYRTTNHPYKIGFFQTTRVRNCEDLPSQLSGLQPVNYREILDGSLDPDFLVDVIGQIVEVSHVVLVSVNGKDTQKISLELRDANDDRLPMVLWGRFAVDVNDAIQYRREQTVVCVLRFGKIKVWKEDRSISNAYNVSEVSLNPSMVEVDEFIQVLPKDEIPLAIVDHKALSLTNGVSEKEDFFTNATTKTISQVLQIDQVEKCVVLCTITGIDSDMGWYYLSCKKCAKKLLTVPSDGGDDEDDEAFFGYSYYCVKCKNHNPTIFPRYKLHLAVMDNSGQTKLMLFDNHAMQLINQPCIELTGHPSKDEIADTDFLPLPLTSLIGKTYLFKIGVEKENFVYKHDTFKVMKIVTNEEMIQEFGSICSAKDESYIAFGTDSSAISDASEGSLMLTDSSSQQSRSSTLTPAKCGAPIINLEENFDQGSVTRQTPQIRIKLEKAEKSG